jgi:hypothetical protein
VLASRADLTGSRRRRPAGAAGGPAPVTFPGRDLATLARIQITGPWSFSTRLRAQVDLDSLSDELLAVVETTMQPTRTSLWLYPTASSAAPPLPAAANPG